MTESEPDQTTTSAGRVHPASRRVANVGRDQPNSDQRTLAMLAHLLGIFTGPIGALIIWLIKRDDEFVESQSREALNFQITVLLATAVSVVLVFVLIGIALLVAITVFNIILCVIAAAQTSSGVAYRYPVILRLINGNP